MKKELPKLIEVIDDECVNCHRCIAVCPVKFCNDGSGDSVKINDNMCIGCGECIKACEHDARQPIDDWDEFMQAVDSKEKIIAIVAPGIVASYPNNYLRINGWLKSLGVEAVFDVSFGAELTIKSYLNYIENKDPELVIAQPCPAIVNYTEIHKPELIKYLAPANSPMVHTIKMIKEFYNEYNNHKVVAISPCIAKKREFDETGYGDYNVIFESINSHFDHTGQSIKDFLEKEFDLVE